MTRQQQIDRICKPVLFIVCMLPFLSTAAGAFGIAGQTLGVNPVEDILHSFGEWALRLLVLTLLVTPLRNITGAHWLLSMRRMIGLFAFFYVLMHFTVWFALDRELNLGAVVKDVLKRPFITIGFLAMLMLIPLAVTSTNAWMRRLGRRWKALHRLVYPIAILGVWHFYWLVKADVREPLIYAAIIAVLLGYRVWKARQRSERAAVRLT